jgi:hypothetical protein
MIPMAPPSLSPAALALCLWLALRRAVAAPYRGLESRGLTSPLWDSWGAVEAFAGQDIEEAVFYPEDNRFLAERDLTVRHYEVAGTE